VATTGNPDASFPYQAVNLSSSSFTLQNNQDFTDPNVQPNGPQNPIIVTEDEVDGWQLMSISCTETSGGPPNTQNTTVDLVNRRATIIAEQAEQVECTFISQELAPTAGGAVVSGRVRDEFGYGIRGIRLAIVDLASGEVREARSNAFGVFAFEDVPVGRTYVLVAYSTKRWAISNDIRSFALNEDIADIDFVADPGGN
jgi:hypothetical protein